MQSAAKHLARFVAKLTFDFTAPCEMLCCALHDNDLLT